MKTSLISKKVLGTYLGKAQIDKLLWEQNSFVAYSTRYGKLIQVLDWTVNIVCKTLPIQ